MLIPTEFESSESIVKGYFFPSSPIIVIATVIFLQGFPGVEGDELICEKLAQTGLNVLTFNYRGIFQSEGYFSFRNAVADIGAALRFVRKTKKIGMHQIDPEKIILGGWSFGGGLTPAGAAQNPGVRRIFTISGRNFGKEARKIEADPEYAKQVSRNLEGLRTPKGPINYQADLIPDLIAYQDSLDYEKLAPVLKDRDILLIGGWNDDLSPIEDYQIPFYRALVENGANKVRIEAVHDGHEFSESKDQLVKIITDWLREEWSDQ